MHVQALFLGYLFGVRSERQLVREIEVNVAYRWFLRMKLTDPVFDASTLSRTAAAASTTRRWRKISSMRLSSRRSAMACRGTVLYTDSTHLKANANKGKYDLEMLQKSRADYWADLDGRSRRNAPPWPEAEEKEREPEVKETVSRTDLDSVTWCATASPRVLLSRSSHGRWPPCHHHRHPCDAGNVHDSIVTWSGSIGSASASTSMSVVGLDAGYARPASPRLEARQILGVTAIATPPKDGMMRNRSSSTSPRPIAIVVSGQALAYATTDRNGYKHYRSDRPSAATARSGVVHLNAKAERTITAMSPRANRRQPQDTLGQGDLQTTKGDG